MMDIFSRYLFSLTSQESHYLLDEMFDQGMIDETELTKKSCLYFAQHMKKNEINSLTIDRASKDDIKSNQFNESFLKNYEELSKNNWALHKQLIKEGVNPNEIAKIIRNDEIEKLQEISSQTDFNYNQKIEPSLYERCSFINQENTTLIDYAAFFGSVKCFKYLLMNGAKLENTGKYAIASGNIEIIHLCEQHHSSFYDSYEAAIEFHRYDIFKYLYENKIVKTMHLNFLYKKCIVNNSYEIFSYLLDKEGLKLEAFIYELSSTGNLYLIKCFFEEYQLPNDIFVSCASSGNIELVKYFLYKKIDVNVSNVSLKNWEIVYISLCFI